MLVPERIMVKGQKRSRATMLTAFWILAVGYLSGTVLQQVLSRSGIVTGENLNVWAMSSGLAVFILTAAAGLKKSSRRFLASAGFAVPVLVVLTVLCIMGTLVLQKAGIEVMQRAYGPAAGILAGFFIDDLFHSFGFAMVMGLGSGGLFLTIMLRRRWTLRWSGSVSAHLGLLLMLLGVVIGSIWGVEGRLNLNEGVESDRFYVRTRDKDVRPHPLGFTLRLDDFRLEHYDTGYDLHVFEVDGKERKKLKTVSADTADTDALKEYGVRILDYSLEGFKPVPVQTEEKKQSAAGVPEHAGNGGNSDVGTNASGVESEHVIITGHHRIAVEPGGTFALPGTGMEIEVINFFKDFVMDMETHSPRNRSDSPENPALEIIIRDSTSTELERTWLFAKFPGFHGRKENAPSAGLRYEYSGDGGDGESSGKKNAMESGGGRKPAVKVMMKKDKSEKIVEAGQPLLMGEKLALVMLPSGGSSIRDYLSTVSILKNGQEVLKNTVEVNHPLEYGGFSIYQSDYRPEDPTFSGFQIVSDPGILIVYLGLALNLAGVLLVIFGQPVARRKKRKSQTGGGGE